MEKIRNKGSFHKSVAYCKANVPVAGRSKANEQTLRTGMNEWKSVETRRNEKKTSETRMNESCEGEKIFALQTPVCCYAGCKSPREAKPMFALICVRLRRQHPNQVLIDNLILLSLRIPGLLWHVPLLLKPAQYLAKTPHRGPKLVKDDVLGKLVLLRLRSSGHWH